MFQILKEPEKKEFYDKYGPEEEVREKMAKQQKYYYEDEMDEFDLFNIFFAGGPDGNFHFKLLN